MSFEQFNESNSTLEYKLRVDKSNIYTPDRQINDIIFKISKSKGVTVKIQHDNNIISIYVKGIKENIKEFEKKLNSTMEFLKSIKQDINLFLIYKNKSKNYIVFIFIKINLYL